MTNTVVKRTVCAMCLILFLFIYFGFWLISQLSILCSQRRGRNEIVGFNSGISSFQIHKLSIIMGIE